MTLLRPRISLIICTYNRVKFLPASLASCYSQSLPKIDYEVIVVNNNSTDGTREFVDAFIESHPDLNIRQVVEKNQGLSYARNRGIEEAESHIITYMDDDGIAETTHLETILKYLEAYPEWAGVGGKVEPIYETHEPEWLNPYLRMMVTRIDFGDRIMKCRGKKYPAGCNMTYRKELLKQAGGFNTALKWRMDDKYIFNRVAEINDEIYYVPEISVKHHIDAARTTDENFDKLSRLMGEEERKRILSTNKLKFPLIVSEYIFKWVASIVIGIWYASMGEVKKARYTIRFRWLAILGLLNM